VAWKIQQWLTMKIIKNFIFWVLFSIIVLAGAAATIF